MLMTVLKGELAVKQSIDLVKTFKKMKDYILENRDLIGQRELICNDLLSSVFSGNHHKLIFSCF